MEMAIEASFTNISWEDSTLTFHAQIDSLVKNLWIRLPNYAEQPDDDLIAGVFAILAGPNIESLRMELDISDHVKDAIEQFCQCQVDASTNQSGKDWTKGFHVRALSFSGGFDSLAALSLMPGRPELVSMDFGGWFQRETDFFVEFNPHVVSTNFRMEGFGRRSWMFMLTGIILLKESLNLNSYTTGSILESSPWNYRKNVDQAFKAAPLLRAFGFEQINPTLGITEVSTTLLAVREFPDLLKRSLKSLAAPGSGKSIRKHMLVHSLSSRPNGQSSQMAPIKFPEKPPLQWGDSLTDDMLTPFLIQSRGAHETSRLMSGVPTALIEMVETFHLTFYKRFHPALYIGIPEDVSTHVHSVLNRNGIEPFTERDWHEYRSVAKFLTDYHQLPEV